MMEAFKILLSKAHAEFRRLRSGELGDNLRAQGISYRVIWGLESYKLKEIAERLLPEVDASAKENGANPSDYRAAYAQILWEEDVRESKMLATRLYPIDKMAPEVATDWSTSVRYTELADQLCMNLLSRTSFAERLVREWLTSGSSDMQKYKALQIALRLDIAVPQAQEMAKDETLPRCIRTAALKLA